MLLTLCYMYSTLMQWWRLKTLRRKLADTLVADNALLLFGGRADCKRCLENLLFSHQGRIACTTVPKQRIHLGHWVAFPEDPRAFPVFFETAVHGWRRRNQQKKIFLHLRAALEGCTSSVDVFRMESMGKLLAWKTSVNHLEVLMETDLSHLAVLMNSFRFYDLAINNELPLLKVETVDVDGVPEKFPENLQKQKRRRCSAKTAIQFAEFVQDLRNLYTELSYSRPKITIESNSNGKAEEERKIPISEVKPFKKTRQNKQDTLEVSSSKTKKSKEVKKQQQQERSTKTAATSTAKEKESAKESSKRTYSEVVVPKNLQRQDATSYASPNTSPAKVATTKPPSILVYGDSIVARENAKKVLGIVVKEDKYTIDDLPCSSPKKFWTADTVLVVVCGSVSANMTPNLLDYLVKGGKLLCLCSDLLYTVLQTFSTAEVREHELVRFSYGEWRRVKMMHHIFCYQASPAKKQFSRDSSDQSLATANNAQNEAAVPRTPSTVCIQHDEKSYKVCVQVLGAEETWQTPSLLLASVEDGGKAVFSQVHLEIDPMQYQDDESKYGALKDSNDARLQILRHLLLNQLQIECSSGSKGDIQYTPAYFLGRHDLKMKLLNENPLVSDKTLHFNDLKAVFCLGKDVDAVAATSNRMPIMVVSCPTDFSTIDYYGTLQTNHLGRLLIYSETMVSTHKVLGGKLEHGLAVVARNQTEGKGRSGNQWLSPSGCLMFSLQIHLDLGSNLGQSIPLVQHLVMVGVAKALKSCHEPLDVALKWPNDLYALKTVKIGGLMATSLIEDRTAIVNIGCGINLDNKSPTLCINDLIESALGPKRRLQYEKLLAKVFNEVEVLLDTTQAKGIDWFLQEYYQHWLHTNTSICVTSGDGSKKQVTVRGVDQYGFLLVEDANGKKSSVQPDGNSFDFFTGLIAPKV